MILSIHDFACLPLFLDPSFSLCILVIARLNFHLITRPNYCNFLLFTTVNRCSRLSIHLSLSSRTWCVGEPHTILVVGNSELATSSLPPSVPRSPTPSLRACARPPFHASACVRPWRTLTSTLLHRRPSVRTDQLGTLLSQWEPLPTRSTASRQSKPSE